METAALLRRAAPASAGAITAADLRARLTEGKVPLKVLAEAIGVCTRSIYSYCNLGLPFLQLGGTRWFDIEQAVAWLTAQQGRPKTASKPIPQPLPGPRGRGRPRKLALT